MDISYWDELFALGISLAALVAGFFTYFIRKKIKNRTKSKDIISPVLDFPEKFWNVHTKILESVTELRVRLDCARVHLVQFHNSGYFLDGISMKKMSHQDLLISMFMPILEIIRKDKSKVYHVNLMEDCYTKQHFDSSNVIAFSALPIRRNNIIVGYIMVQWCSWNKVDLIEENLVEDWLDRSQSLIEVELINQKRQIEHK